MVRLVGRCILNNNSSLLVRFFVRLFVLACMSHGNLSKFASVLSNEQSPIRAFHCLRRTPFLFDADWNFFLRLYFQA